MVFPQITHSLFYIINGVILISYGIIKIIGYYSNDLFCLAFQHDLANGVFLIVSGLIILIYHHRMYSYLPMEIGGLILLDSLLKIQTSGDAKKFGLEKWYRILIFSLITGLFGFLTIMCTFHKNMPLRFILGCALLSEGFMSHYLIHITVKKREDHLLAYKNN